MGLFDAFRRPAQPPEHIAELYRRLGRVEAEVESVRLQWASYRDELKRLVLRLEKRDERAQERAQATIAAEETPQLVRTDEISELVRNRRRRHVP